ncbi:histidine kinase [Alsobacter soli]|uniref:histidine kinase n=1 Tax=Alsobacter soli TaxID=2109933 RepID=A0A2T1HU49_9HYPH|nr:ATP-binding protein [Alsobacter soli]PSC05148.1 histidine kinase [Alsobacter soli]
MRHPILSTALRSEMDVVYVRQRARSIAERLGFDQQDQTRIATAVSEIARNAYAYGGGGKAEFFLETDARPQEIAVRISDTGPGIRQLETILEGRYKSRTGMGLGIIGAKRLMDQVSIETAPGKGAVVDLRKARPERAAPIQPSALSSIAASVARESESDPMGALREQNRELLNSLSELKERNEELNTLSRELEDTNRGVVALYSELDEKAEQLRQASELKTRFLSNMSHEFRTPLNSILAISRMLLDRLDGDLSAEQEKQVGYIRQSAEHLTELVNDLLDLAKVEAGKLDVKVTPFTVTELFGGLRGAMKPLQTADAVSLTFEEEAGLPALRTDEGKVAQILRNFISNALKFTEAGEVKVSAGWNRKSGEVVFAVSDTGIGIAPADQERIFDEFVQVENRLQARSKGTGLGLPLSRKLAELLKGAVSVTSEPGKGSTFVLRIPASYAPAAPGRGATGAAGLRRVLVVDDDEAFRYVVRQIISSEPGFEVAEAANGADALELIRSDPPDAIILDMQMPVMDGPSFLRALQGEADMASLPVIVSTSHVIDPDLRRKVGSARAVLSKETLSKEVLMSLLAGVTGPAA